MNHFYLQKAKEFLMWILFPPCCPACGRSIARDEIFCPSCLKDYFPASSADREWKQLPSGVNLYAAARYKGSMREAIHRFKFSGHAGSAAILAPLLVQALRENGVKPEEIQLLVPVPSRPKKVRARGYNQSALLAREVSRLTDIPFSETALLKTRDTRAQHDLNAEERQTNLSGSFRAEKAAVSGKHILLVDDILTTGATARECIGALKDAGASSVDILVLAVTQHQTGYDGAANRV